MTEQNTLSISELQQQANAGDAQAQFDLAWHYLREDKETALKWLNKAAEQGLAGGQLALGLCYFQGINKKLVDKVRVSLFENLEDDLEHKNSFYASFILMYFKDETDGRLAFTWFKKAAEQHCREAEYLLAVCYRDGIGIKQNHELAFAWFGKAAEQGFAAAQCDLAKAYHEGKGVEQNNELALAWLNKAVEQTDAYIANVDLGECLSIVEYCQQYPRCFADHSKCVPEAYFLMGELYAQGKGVEQCDETACHWYQKAAEMKVAEAQYRLALGYFEGKNVEKDYGLGMKWLREAAIQNHEAANAWLENAYLRLAFPHLVDKENAEEDYQFAFDWCCKEAEQDSADAYLCLGILYLFGKGVEQNDERAYECFSKADWAYDTRNGELHIITDFTLGICYAQGKGVEKNISAAERCFERSSDYKVGQILMEGNLETVSSGHKVQIIPIPLLIVESLLKKNEIESAGKFVEETSMDRHNKSFFLTAVSELGKTNRELALKDKQLREAEKDLEDMMSMFAHKFRSPLDAIMYNTNHENIPKLYAEAAQTMRGLLDIFSTISTDDTILPAKIKADCQGNARLMTVLSKTLNMMLLHLLSASGTEKIHQHYLAYAKAHGKVAASVTDKEWYDEHFELEQALQAEWEQGFAYLLSQSAPLAERLAWLEQHFFKLELIGFDRDDIQFKEYAITESLLTILLNEILVNAFKYYSSETQQAVILEWSERNGKQILSCCNPSIRRERTTIKGSGKGHTFLSVLARKIGGQFIKPKPQDDFVLEFGIPNELLIANPAGGQ